MCLAVPGQIESLSGAELERSGTVNFGGIRKSVNLSFVPEAEEGDYVLVHVGVAIGIIDPDEAGRVFSYLEELEEETAIEGSETRPREEQQARKEDRSA